MQYFSGYLHDKYCQQIDAETQSFHVKEKKLGEFLKVYQGLLENQIFKLKFTIFRCLEMIEKPPRCILRLLSEQCHMPQVSIYPSIQ